MQALVRTGVPGVVVRLQRGSRVYNLAEGRAALGGRRVRSTDRFRIASETKTFTAVVALKLVRAGRLRLDDSVERWLPGLVPNGNQITVRDLLQMTSGLPDYFVANPSRVMAPLRNPRFSWTAKALIRISTSMKPEFPPGKGWSYSNTNYLLLQLIVERAAHTPFAAELRRLVLLPLRLRHTVYPAPSNRRMPVPHARGYQLGGHDRKDVTATSPSIAQASGALISTPADVATFFRALNGGSVLPRRLLAKMRTAAPASGRQHYGLGLFRLQAPGCGRTWGHNGEILGYHSFAMTTADGRSSFALSMNASGPPSKDFEVPGSVFEAKQNLVKALVCWAAPGER